jgi:FkbM family methyltransferase
VGLYTKIFAEKTGSKGGVFAFEPMPEFFKELCAETRAYPWVRNENLALSDFDGTSRILIDKTATMGHLETFAGESSTGKSVAVTVTRGDAYLTKSGVTPNLLKIDVEGFEEEVLAGMPTLLTAPELRAVFVEVHFAMLEERGHADAPLRIEKMLRSKGLVPKWVDASHIVAKRRTA